MHDKIAHFDGVRWQLMGDIPANNSWTDMLMMWLHLAIWLVPLIIILYTTIKATVRIVPEYGRIVVFRLGRFQSVRGPGFILLVPFFDKIQADVYLRTEAMELQAENTMTRDTVAVTVDAVVFWRVVDPKIAVLDVQNFSKAIKQVALMALREMIGSSSLAELLSNRAMIDERLRDAIELRVQTWGLDVSSVDIKDVAIPDDLEDAMSREAQAVREGAARITLANAEVEIAEKTAAAAKIYDETPTALRLRQMGLVYEMGKNGTTILIPTDMASSVMGGAIALAAKS